MKKKRTVLTAVLLAALVLAGAYTAASAAAGSGDPLVTLSYLTGVFAPQMKNEMQDLVDNREIELTYKFNQALSAAGGGTGSGTGAAVFSVVTLSQGQTLVGDVGCEVMLRVGSATCSSSGTTGLIDTTDGTVLGNGGALVTNHLYMVTISTRSVVAGPGTVKVLARGPYTVQ